MGGWLNNTRVRFRRVVDSRQTMAVRLATMMRRPLLQAVLAAVAVSLAIPIALIVTRTLYWTVGVVLPGSCTRVADAHLCQVELVPGGTHVTARSDSAVPVGKWVKLRTWHNPASGKDTVVR